MVGLEEGIDSNLCDKFSSVSQISCSYCTFMVSLLRIVRRSFLMKMKKKVKILKYTAVFEPAKEGGFVVTVPALPGLVTEGDTFEEAVKMVKDAIKYHCASLMKSGLTPFDFVRLR